MKQTMSRETLRLIDLEQPRPGFSRFISSWLLQTGGANILVDPGPSGTIPTLIRTLAAFKVRRLDWILLTHVHIDHGGGVAELLDAYPGTPVVCHPRGMEHVANPEKLWEVSLKNLGWIAEMYGRPRPVPAESLLFRERFETAGGTIECIDTPGHAPHHLAFKVGGIVFTGEAAGIYLGLDNGFYLRVGAPPGGFHYPAYRRSLETIASLDASLLCFAHWGCTEKCREIMNTAIEQADLWMELSVKHAGAEGGKFEERVLEELLERDPGLARLSTLPDEVRMRERAVLPVSVAGMKRHVPGRQRTG
ncbi:MAG: MBL fold metallo-hydrolase [Syntrophales bacterium]|nr:MBL fold metallo-hydrolase [Syntrophales bacterium]